MEYVRKITAIQTDAHGYVSTVKGDDWPARTARHVVEDLELGLHAYSVQTDHGETIVYDASDDGGRYLRADDPTTGENALLSLPTF